MFKKVIGEAAGPPGLKLSTCQVCDVGKLLHLSELFPHL